MLCTYMYMYMYTTWYMYTTCYIFMYCKCTCTCIFTGAVTVNHNCFFTQKIRKIN